ncbi:non-canonical purine NTP pyrophosphatase [Candidatus Nanohalobium constans]|uniref:XTP/dITP diphosphohydrolase n=1 Tax=Candidatus Nanohalobium constans TaxID=2565781 RepID=A0A5Q0UFU2_9ARCH|nr:non-canonical purine NTP pyrophosphatase [Candidatus Nanohalobium constans]QGA80466.1 XTP/dITP diphosphohydrolase [Candidatus Nanohalobium constans]
MEVLLITGNPEKVEAAEKAFEKTEINVKQLDDDHPEIQASNSLEVAKNRVKKAIRNHDNPVIREDHSLYLDAIPGFPGPYMSYFDDNLNAEKLVELLEDKKRTGYFEIATVIGFPDGKIKEYESKVPIKISKEVRGQEGNLEKVLMLEKSDKTFAETDSESRIELWNKNFREIAKELSK